MAKCESCQMRYGSLAALSRNILLLDYLLYQHMIHISQVCTEDLLI